MIRPPFAYFGGKSRLAPWIAGALPEHKVYVEAFAGSAAVLFAKPPVKVEVLNDLDDGIVNFFQVLRDRPDDLERVCRLTPHARVEFERARIPADDPLESARRWWVRIGQQFGRVGSGSGWSLSTSRGGSDAASMQGLVDRFHAVARRLITVSIENRSALELIPRLDRPDGCFYLDPPYLSSTRRGLDKRTKDYANEFCTDDEHVALAEVATACSGAVVISGYPSPLYEQLYDGWYRTERAVHVHAGRMQGQPGRRAVEVLWSNRPLQAQLSLTARNGR